MDLTLNIDACLLKCDKTWAKEPLVIGNCMFEQKYCTIMIMLGHSGRSLMIYLPKDPCMLNLSSIHLLGGIYGNPHAEFDHFAPPCTLISKYTIWCTLQVDYSENKPKMAYSCDLPKMARQQCGIMDWNCSDT